MLPLRRLKTIKFKKNPRTLLRLFVITMLASMVLIVSLAGFGFSEVFRRYVISNAEYDAISVSNALLAEQRENIVVSSKSGASRIQISAAELPQLDRSIRKLLSPLAILKIKIYSADTRIVYSTDAKLIGQMNPKNPRLKHALAGSYDSKFETKEKMLDLDNELKFNVDFVETYIPVTDQNKKVIGCLEIYRDVSQYRDETRRVLALSLGMLTLIMAFVFGLSFFLIRKATMDLEEIQEMLKAQATTDSLTGTCNKRQILVMAHKEFSRATRKRKKGLPEPELGFIMIDVDLFKRVNDTYGHLAGDVLLKELAERISCSLRAYDTLGRFGGDEFLVILPGSSLEESRSVAQKILKLIREEPFILEGNSVFATASLGVAAAQEDDLEYTQVLKRADEALYKAKSSGRDWWC
jgi:diguanylate cyclase (GGDEF)-like protein